MTPKFRRLSRAAAFVAVAFGFPHSCPAATITLPDAIQRALRNAPSIEAANAAGDMTRAQTREARAALYPSVAAGAEYYQAPGYSEVITNRGLSAAMLTLDYTAWDWGRRAARVRAAEYVGEAAQFGVAAARAQIVFDTTVAYFDLDRARDTERELGSSLVRLTTYAATIEALRKSGRAQASDVLKARSSRDTVELSIAAARGDRDTAASALGSLIGFPSQAELEIVEISGVPPKPAGDIAQSPVMRAANRAIECAKMQIQAAKAERLPTVQLAYTTGFVGVDPPATIGHNFGGSYDTVVSMPIFDGGAISARIDQAMAKQRAAIAQAHQAEYLLSRRIAGAQTHYDQAIRQLAVLDRAQATADDSFALTWTKFLGGGNATMLEVLDSYEHADELRIQRFQQTFDAREAAAEVNLLYGNTQ